MDVRNKTALVTGGTDGIGFEIAVQLQRAGCAVIVVGRQEVGLRRAETNSLQTIKADLSTMDGCAEVLDLLSDTPLDLLVNNAGVDPSYRIDQPIDITTIDRAIFLNLNAPIRLISGLLPGMIARPQACIVNVTSGLAIAPSADTPVYCATKAGLRSFTLALRAQLSKTNVSVVEALPPMVDTAMTSAINKNGKMKPAECARQIIAAIMRDRKEANIGEVKLLRMVYSMSPRLARRIMLAS